MGHLESLSNLVIKTGKYSNLETEVHGQEEIKVSGKIIYWTIRGDYLMLSSQLIAAIKNAKAVLTTK